MLVFVQHAAEDGGAQVSVAVDPGATAADVLRQLELPAGRRGLRVLSYQGVPLAATDALADVGAGAQAKLAVETALPPFAWARCSERMAREGTKVAAAPGATAGGHCVALGEWGCAEGGRVRWRVRKAQDGGRGTVGVIAVGAVGDVDLDRSPFDLRGGPRFWGYQTGNGCLMAGAEQLSSLGALPSLTAEGEEVELRVDRGAGRAEWWVRGACVAAADTLPTDAPLHLFVAFSSAGGAFDVTAQE